MIRIRRASRGGLRNRPQGFSLIEVLIALVVLALGLLGLAFLQVLNVRYTNSAQHRTVATNLAYEMLDMMRTNQLVVDQYRFDFTAAAAAPGGCDRNTGAGAGDYVAKIARWQCEVSANLPGGRARVEMVGNTATVTIRWTDDVGADPGINQSRSDTTEFAVSTVL